MIKTLKFAKLYSTVVFVILSLFLQAIKDRLIVYLSGRANYFAYILENSVSDLTKLILVYCSYDFMTGNSGSYVSLSDYGVFLQESFTMGEVKKKKSLLNRVVLYTVGKLVSYKRLAAMLRMFL